MRFGIGLVATASLAIVGLGAPLGAQQTTASQSVWDGIYTLQQAKRGALKSGLCTSCHGDSFEGLLGPALAGPAFTERWDGRTVGDLFAHILAVNKYPSGMTEIGIDAGPLKQIRIEPAKR